MYPPGNEHIPPLMAFWRWFSFSPTWYFCSANRFDLWRGVWAWGLFFPGVKHSLRMLEVGNLNTEYLCLRSSLNLEIAKELSKKLLFHYSLCDLCLFFCLLLGLSQSRQQLTSFRGTKSTTAIAASNQFCCCWSGTSGGTCTQRVSPNLCHRRSLKFQVLHQLHKVCPSILRDRSISLKLTVRPLKIGRAPKGNDCIPTIHFQVLLLLALGSVDLLFKNASNHCESDEIPGLQVAKVEFVPGIQMSLAVLWNRKRCGSNTQGKVGCLSIWVCIIVDLGLRYTFTHDQNLFPQRFWTQVFHFSPRFPPCQTPTQMVTEVSHTEFEVQVLKEPWQQGSFLVATWWWFIFDDDSIKINDSLVEMGGIKNCWSILYCHHKIMWYDIMPYTSKGRQRSAMQQRNIWWNIVSLQLQYWISWHLR